MKSLPENTFTEKKKRPKEKISGFGLYPGIEHFSKEDELKVKI